MQGALSFPVLSICVHVHTHTHTHTHRAGRLAEQDDQGSKNYGLFGVTPCLGLSPLRVQIPAEAPRQHLNGAGWGGQGAEAPSPDIAFSFPHSLACWSVTCSTGDLPSAMTCLYRSG